VAAILLATAAGGASVRAAFPGANGEIAFVRDGAIWAVASDGTGLRQVTHPKLNIDDDSISWSPDGSQLAFVRTDYATCGIPCYSVDTIRSDGTGLKAGDQSYEPRWSPDGTRLISTYYVGSNLRYVTTELGTTNLRTGGGVVLAPRALRRFDTVLRFGYEIYDYAWSPSGGWICFSRVVGAQHALLALVRPNGTALALLGALHGFDCGWAPDSKRVLFTDGLNISSVGLDGTGLEPLTNQHRARELAPVSSPDGTTIAFLRQESGGKHPPYDLWTIAADGSSQTMIATDVSHASWSPDGTMIAFIKGGRPSEDGSYKGEPKPQGLWLTHPDGSAQIEIATGATEFDWQARSR
jgi:Tol biopolymer transport system component